MPKSAISKFVKSYWEYYLELEDQFKRTQKYVAFDIHNKATYSVEYLKLIQAVCSEIDVVAKEIATFFDSDFAKIENPNIQKWGYILCNKLTYLKDTSVTFYDDFDFMPWEKFGYCIGTDSKGRKIYKLSPQCNTPKWWTAYNKIKHERTSLNSDGKKNYTKANLQNMIYSFGALYLLETMFMEYLTKEEKTDCNINKSQLFSVDMRERGDNNGA